MTEWVSAGSIDRLRDGPVLVKHGRHQVAVFRLDHDLHAVDNRCPHEGYPLSAGSVSDQGVLTCNWHNWKFRLSDGRCLLGGDNVRSYPVRQEDEEVWVDLADPPRAQIEGRILDGLETAFEDRDFGRICRELARLHYHGSSPEQALVKALEWAHDRLEFGTTHAFAASADWLGLSRRLSGGLESRLICLAEAVDHLAFDSLRHPRYPYAPPGHLFGHAAWLEAVEEERLTDAEGMAARGLVDGLHWPDMEETFAEAALAHYNDFGHSLIYVLKTRQLIEMLGPDVERFLLGPLTRHIVYAPREDLIPEFKGYPPVLAGLSEAGSHAGGGSRLEVPFPATTAQALDWLKASISGHSTGAVYSALLEALALNMLHYDSSFDTAFDRPVSQNTSWLAFTHGITFSNAARVMCSIYPRLWPQALAQMACFLGRNRRFIDADSDQSRWRVVDTGSFISEAHSRLLDHGLRDPIFSCHLLKTSVAVEDEMEHVSASCRQALVSSLNRFLHSPIKMKHVRRLARQAIALVSRDFGTETTS